MKFFSTNLNKMMAHIEDINAQLKIVREATAENRERWGMSESDLICVFVSHDVWKLFEKMPWAWKLLEVDKELVHEIKGRTNTSIVGLWYARTRGESQAEHRERVKARLDYLHPERVEKAERRNSDE